jgi:hypothetical protein
MVRSFVRYLRNRQNKLINLGTKWIKRSGADGFSSAAKMKSRAYSKCMGAINLHSKPEKLANTVTPVLLTIFKKTYVEL